MTKFKKNAHLSFSLYLSIDRKYAKCRTKANAHDKMGFQYISISVDCADPEGGQGVRTPPPEKSQKYRIS